MVIYSVEVLLILHAKIRLCNVLTGSAQVPFGGCLLFLEKLLLVGYNVLWCITVSDVQCFFNICNFVINFGGLTYLYTNSFVHKTFLLTNINCNAECVSFIVGVCWSCLF